ncbi:PUG domain containing protein, partial [Trema orientale]
RKKIEEEEKRLERETEKERIRSGKELIEAKRILEENERKRYLALRQSEKEEEKRAREKIRWKLEQDKLERRGTKLQMPLKNPAPLKLSIPVLQEKQNSKLVKPVTKAELMKECLRSLKRNHTDNDARVRRAFQTLLIYVGNVARNPHEEKFRRIRLSNPLFQERVGSLKGGVDFLELCGFERTEEGEFLYLPQEKVNMAVLNSAGSELKSAITNPFFGVLSRPIEESGV